VVPIPGIQKGLQQVAGWALRHLRTHRGPPVCTRVLVSPGTSIVRRRTPVRQEEISRAGRPWLGQAPSRAAQEKGLPMAGPMVPSNTGLASTTRGKGVSKVASVQQMLKDWERHRTVLVDVLGRI